MFLWYYQQRRRIVHHRLHPKAHFADLLERYGSPLLVLDLVKQAERKPREGIVGRDYRLAIEHVNSTMPPVSSTQYFFNYAWLSQATGSFQNGIGIANSSVVLRSSFSDSAQAIL